MIKIIKILSLIITIFLAFLILSFYFYGPVEKNDEVLTFIVPQNNIKFDLIEELHNKGIIKNKNASRKMYSIIYNNFHIKEGGYYLNKNMYTWQIFNIIKKNKPDLVWINIKFCPRKEQVGELLRNNLNWNDRDLEVWNKLYEGQDYFEGVYYPDTYLIPINESPEKVAKRLISRFENNIVNFSKDLEEKNVSWLTALKIASLVARESGSTSDAKIVSSVIWNRLNEDMRLQIDATMQYTKGKNENGSWWGNISLEEKRSNSLYNTYKHKGLPPTPICSPNIAFIEAAINPEKTDCLFYLHDENRNIHCSKTYEEHVDNINKYLK